MAVNQVVSGSLLSWNTVPAVSRTCRLHRLPWKALRVLSSPKLRPPQTGQVRPARQRISTSAARQAPSAPLGAEALAELGLAQPRIERRNPFAAAIRRLRQPRKPQKP